MPDRRRIATVLRLMPAFLARAARLVVLASRRLRAASAMRRVTACWASERLDPPFDPTCASHALTAGARGLRGGMGVVVAARANFDMLLSIACS